VTLVFSWTAFILCDARELSAPVVVLHVLVAGELLACLYGVRVQHILERKQESRSNNTLSDLGADT
jgi:hypothetical protein